MCDLNVFPNARFTTADDDSATVTVQSQFKTLNVRMKTYSVIPCAFPEQSCRF
jgi:hypothetical protein